MPSRFRPKKKASLKHLTNEPTLSVVIYIMFIRAACELHLDGYNDSIADTVTAFLESEGNKLFVWRSTQEEQADIPLEASISSFPETFAQSIVFYKNGGQLQCIVTNNRLQLLQQLTGLFGDLDVPNVPIKLKEIDQLLHRHLKRSQIPHVVLEHHPLDLDSEQTDEFLNNLQDLVKDWIQLIQTVTTLGDVPMETASGTVIYYQQLHAELEHIQSELIKPDVKRILSILNTNKRFVAVRALENNTGLETAMNVVSDRYTVLKNYNIAELQVVSEFDKLSHGIHQLMDYLPKKLRSSRHFSLEMGLELVSVTTLEVRDCLLQILQSSNFWNDYASYENDIRYPSLDVLSTLDDQISNFKDFCQEHGRRRKLTGVHRLVESKLVLHHVTLQQRLDRIHELRQSHEQLRHVMSSIQQGDNIAVPDPRTVLSNLDLLDLSPSGQTALDIALENYDVKMDELEEKLAKLLRDKLTAAQDAEDMFAVFARFRLLLSRTRVRAAVKEFQLQLIATVSTAIEKLQSKFTLKYEQSAAARLSRLRGIPPVAGKILWAKQMERQVNLLMERMSNVLGPQWGQQLEGRQLRKSGDELLAKLDARGFFRSWVTEWEKELTISASSKLNSYPVIVDANLNGDFEAKVNFDEKNELLFKEIRHLKWLGFGKDIPKTLTMVSEESNARYPFAIAIKTALRSYQAVRVLITPELEPLVLPQLLEIRECVAEAFDVKLSSSTAVSKKRRVRWETKDMTEWVTKLTESVTKFEDRVEQLLRACDKVDIALNLLEEVSYDGTKFQAVMTSIQKTIDEMSLSGYSDLDSWVKVVSDNMASVLAKRLEGALRAWNKKFKVIRDDGKEETEHSEISTPDDDIPDIDIQASVSLEIVLRNQVISAVPAIPTVRSLMISALHEYIGVVCNLTKPKGGRYEVFDSIAAKSDHSTSLPDDKFDALVTMVPSALVAEAYGSIDDHIEEASSFSEQWLAYQTLWDTQVSDVASAVGTDIDRWQSLLQEASEARSTLDSTATVARFGPIVVEYAKVQSQINLKYDSWQKELQASFASILGQCVRETHDKIAKAKTTLEETTLDSASTESIVVGVTFIQEMRQKIGLWTKEIDGLKESEKVLKRQRYAFHSEWMETSVVKGLSESMMQILEKRSRTMEQQVPVLQARVTAEDKSAAKKLKELLEKWAEDKPLRGDRTPPDALAVLTQYELTLKKASVHQENLVRAKDALGLEDNLERSEVTDCLNELADLKEVWEAMTDPYKALDVIKDTSWTTAVMRKVRRGLDDLLVLMRSLPNRIRQYDAYTQLHDSIKGFITGHSFLSELKTDALKERHWKTILQRLGIHIPFTDLTVGILWDHGVLNRKKEMHEILTIAQGEMALEVFLGDVRDRWMKQELELVLFQSRTRLIKGWDDLFATLDDHIGGLALMKSSPFYRSVREFQEEGKLWEDRLTKLRAAFDAWVDVQRRWVYLEGILFGSSDIKAQLPAEWSRFKSVDSEFIALMRRIASKPNAMEVLNIDNLQRTLERLGNLMNVIQRALGDYLAKQRSDFSRFYFLGDDDLLEIMGNSGEPGKVLAHVGKMFSGIAGAKLTTDGVPEDVHARLEAMVSKDGEVVPFHEPIDITAQTNVKEWLKALEDGMRMTLALLLEKAVSEDAFSAGETLDDNRKKQFVDWTTKFPAQVMILATQVNWSMGVDKALTGNNSSDELKTVLLVLEWKLEVMANTVLQELPPEHRKKFEQLITELVRQRDVVRSLIDDKVSNVSDFRWQYHLRYNYNPKAENLEEKLVVSLSNAKFYYGFEYLGIGERLVQTPLTDRCYLTLTQALHFRMGGSPFGPAGTGKVRIICCWRLFLLTIFRLSLSKHLVRH